MNEDFQDIIELLIEHDAAWSGRTVSPVDGLDIAFLGRSELIRNKRAAGRPKDLLDLALLEEA